MIKKELEKTYMFKYDDIDNIISYLGITEKSYSNDIIDYYLNKRLRIRVIDNEQCILTRKIEDQNKNCRLEHEEKISKETASLLLSDNKLKIKKHRHVIKIPGATYKIMIDIIESPMKIVKLEIESLGNDAPPGADDIFKGYFRECPLNTWDFFKQKIGICGAPSSGKTETAKALSLAINTQLNGNSFNITEYATSFIQKNNIHPSEIDQFIIWHSQQLREKTAMSRSNIVISDCPTFLSYIYIMFNNNDIIDTRMRINITKLYKRVLEDVSSYSKIIYLKSTCNYNNGIRFQTDSEVRHIDKMIYAFLENHNIPFETNTQDHVANMLSNIFFLNRLGDTA